MVAVRHTHAPDTAHSILRRTKTSGADKGRQALPAFVSRHGWVERAWLQAGLEIWEGDESHGSFGYKRDFFLPQHFYPLV